MLQTILGIIGVMVSVVVALVGWLIKQSRESTQSMNAAIKENTTITIAQGTAITRVETQLTSVVNRVDDLTQWRDQERQRQLDELRAELRRVNGVNGVNGAGGTMRTVAG